MQNEATEREESSDVRGIDASMDRRPGVPQKKEPSPAGDPPYSVPSRQRVVDGLVKDAQRDEWTATFGTGQAPKGLSGLMRRAAYQIPDYRIRRWALLLAADRVDMWEHRLARAARSPATWAALVLGLAAVGAAAVGTARLAKQRRARARKPMARLRAMIR